MNNSILPLSKPAASKYLSETKAGAKAKAVIDSFLKTKGSEANPHLPIGSERSSFLFNDQTAIFPSLEPKKVTLNSFYNKIKNNIFVSIL